jgi:hypothetical protein
MDFCLEIGDGIFTLNIYLDKGEVKIQWEKMVANLKDFLLRCFDCDLHGSSQRCFEDISLIYNKLLRKSLSYHLVYFCLSLGGDLHRESTFSQNFIGMHHISRPVLLLNPKCNSFHGTGAWRRLPLSSCLIHSCK